MNPSRSPGTCPAMARATAVALAITAGSLGIGAVVVGACGIYDSSLLVASSDAAVADAGASHLVVEAGTSPDADTCAHLSPPARPTTNDGAEALDLVFASTFLRFSRVGPPASPVPPTGYDLDHICTCPGPEACKPLSTQTHCDGDGGTDDTAGGIFDTIATLAPDRFSDMALNKDLLAGNKNVILRVRSYNGGKNDLQVTAIIYASNGLADHVDGGSSTPLADGTDVWTIDPASLLGGTSVDAGPTCEGNDNVCVPFFADTEAYVSNGVLVAHLDFPIVVGSGDATFVAKLTQSTITATITRDASGGAHIDDGQVTGRWATGSLLTSLSSVHDPFDKSMFLCGDSGSYQNAKSIICSGADLPEDPADDGKGTSCGALSAAIGFAAVQAHLGQIYDSPPIVGSCGDGYKDDCSH